VQAAVAAAVAAVRAPSCVCVFFALPPPAAVGSSWSTTGKRRGGWGVGGLAPSPYAMLDTAFGPVALGVPHYCPSPSSPIAPWLAAPLLPLVGSSTPLSPLPATPHAGASATVVTPRPLWVIRLHAPSLHPLGFDLLEALGSLSPSLPTANKGTDGGVAAGGVAAGGGAGGLANAVIIDWSPATDYAAMPSGSGGGVLPRAAPGAAAPSSSTATSATFSLDSLPLNTLVVTCDDGCYLHPNVTARLRGDVTSMDVTWPTPLPSLPPASAVSAPLPPSAVSGGSVARLDVRRLGDTLMRLLQLRRETWDCEAKEGAQLTAIATRLEEDTPPPHLHDLLARVERLRHVRDALLVEATQSESPL